MAGRSTRSLGFMSGRVRPRIGDVIEIETPKGKAYAHYTHRHTRYGALLRVLPGITNVAPTDFARLVEQSPQFMTFFPLGAACARRLVRIVANEAVPDSAKAFPIFRSGARNLATGKVANWWLWDGEKEWKVGRLSPGMETMPLRGVWNDTMLIKRIVDGWRHEHEA